ncbi:NAD-dependent epimerase/dehydratase family protein [Thioclava sp. JE_KL1]|uniref:NAD-dependent epimerase/dehydratase family protein n=1 Tax=Thioclava sp. JE_KL1 TaxID=2651187 RepID=UPI0034D2BD73
MKHVLVTGGARYIGSHACKALAAAGYVPSMRVERPDSSISRTRRWRLQRGRKQTGKASSFYH